jgi:hypothetical protein
LGAHSAQRWVEGVDPTACHKDAEARSRTRKGVGFAVPSFGRKRVWSAQLDIANAQTCDKADAKMQRGSELAENAASG